jgi:hypothetical protein
MMRNRSEPGHVLLIILMGASIATCQDAAGPEPEAVFEVKVVDETFRIGVNDPVQIDSFAARLASGAEGNLNGVLKPGDGGVNTPWSWHLDPETVQVADLTMEVCDGRPSMVEEDLDYWLESVERYCPWGARVTARIR